MRSVRLGRAGLQVSEVGLGAMNFGSELSESESVAIMDEAADRGIYLFDTADVYPIPQGPATWGLSEQIVGRWMRGKRDSIVLASKCGNRVGPGANDVGGSRKHIIEACENSLRRLGTDWLDIYYLHLPDLLAPIDESLEALDRLVQDGKVLYTGLSNFTAWQVALAMEAIAERHLTRITVIQERYNLVARMVDRNLLPLASAAGVGIVAYNPLGGGVLAGMLGRGDAVPDTGRFTMKLYQDRYLRAEVFDVVEALGEIARTIDCSSAQVALAWIRAQPHHIVPLVGALRPEHITDIVKGLDVALPTGSIEKLNALSERFRDS